MTTTPTSDELDDAIARSAAAPQRSEHGDDVVVEHPLKDQIAAAQYLKAQEASATTGLGIRFRKIKPVYE